MKPPCLEKIGLPVSVTQQLHKNSIHMCWES